ncbi:MAG: Ldh family oxidoreductase [Candidatus Lokiarchaeota archaeon]|nr:Ldh family oxidoreductase [Candidatus Lokiarchaeota archaeon]MBD3211246.1 Ldh family oxidoreductase [Candidatus Lokiarchaeota archaeon]
MTAVINESEGILIKIPILRNFLEDVFISLGVPKNDAKIIADVLLTADLKGISTHGIQRLKVYYERLKKGIYNPKTRIKIIKETPTTAVLDGNCGMGHVIAHRAMNIAIEKAKKHGLGAVAVRNSTHFGIAGYYSQIAIDEGMIGITTTNATPAVPPTNGVEPLLGTNPLTAGLPTDEEFPFLLDCATSIIQKGKIEMCKREGRTLPQGLIIDEFGNSETDPNKIIDKLNDKKAAILPLGSIEGNSASYKGYGYSTLVEILSSALQDGASLKETAGIYENGKKRLKVGHFFLAINIEFFISTSKFKQNVGKILRKLRNAKKAPNKNRIYTAGEKEYEASLDTQKMGIFVNKSIQEDLREIRDDLELYNYDSVF